MTRRSRPRSRLGPASPIELEEFLIDDGSRVRDVFCAFEVVKQEVADSVNPRSVCASFSADFLLRARRAEFRVTEVGVHHYPRTVGSAKGATPAVILRTFREMFTLWAHFHGERRQPDR